MDVINRLKSTITNVITGNPLIAEFEILEHKGSGGPGMMWRIHAGVKRSTKQEVSLFIFEKKQLERYPRRDRDLIVDVLKKGVQQMTRLRHPKILSVLHPVEESREVLAFATEPVLMSLANILGKFNNLPGPIRGEIKEFKLYDVEIKYGLLHITEGLGFLHNDVKMIHNGLCPESIYINKTGSWKLSGFDFCIPNANQQDNSPYYPFKEWEPHFPPVTKPNLDYLAPEYAVTQSCDTSADLFSLGMLMYAIFNGGKTLYDCRGEWNTFKQNAKEARCLKNLKPSILGSVPMDVRDHVKMLLNSEPTVRPDADQMSKIPFFEDVGAMTLQYMETLVQRDNLQKSQFFKGMPKILQKMPKRVCIQRILPALFSECTNPNMIPFVLPNVMEIAEQCSEKEFAQHILPGLIPIFSIPDPIQVRLIWLLSAYTETCTQYNLI
ncbi:hypothetical protein LSH36_20g02000 [Paralvinella palmiformis]|uniref:Protein kinase domain-containing protein n=1 Tax=Paralvinella palmiformis TaxID=53620 RepID=A0AAD9NH56_9ANNE|nr:hypothetical protein LSH36_20g02000 [Paralvinella palmiformis]